MWQMTIGAGLFLIKEQGCAETINNQVIGSCSFSLCPLVFAMWLSADIEPLVVALSKQTDMDSFYYVVGVFTGCVSD